MNNNTLRRFLPVVLTFALFITIFSFGTTSNAATAVTGADIVKFAKTLEGKAYAKNGTGPNSFDNWGLTQYIYKNFGVALGDSASSQSQKGTVIKKGYAVKEGDLLFFALKGTSVDTVGIYIGNDQMLAVTSAGKKVKVYNARNYIDKYQGARRLVSLATSPVVTPPTTVEPTPAPAPQVSERDQLAAKIVAASKQYLGVKYKLGGNYDRDGSYMFDCSSFTQKVFSDVGIKIPRTATQQKNATKAISKSSIQVGDLVYFDLNQNGSLDHVGIYIGNGDFIHASTAKNRDVQISNLETMSYWKNRFHSASRAF